MSPLVDSEGKQKSYRKLALLKAARALEPEEGATPIADAARATIDAALARL